MRRPQPRRLSRGEAPWPSDLSCGVLGGAVPVPTKGRPSVQPDGLLPVPLHSGPAQHVTVLPLFRQ